jgi:hypothetical protein
MFFYRFGIPLKFFHKLNESSDYLFTTWLHDKNELATIISVSFLREATNVRVRQLVFSSEHFSYRNIADMINCIT